MKIKMQMKVKIKTTMNKINTNMTSNNMKDWMQKNWIKISIRMNQMTSIRMK